MWVWILAVYKLEVGEFLSFYVLGEQAFDWLLLDHKMFLHFLL